MSETEVQVGLAIRAEAEVIKAQPPSVEAEDDVEGEQ